MQIRCDVTLNDTRLRQIVRDMPVATEDLLDAATDAVVQGAQERAPVRTGWLRESIYKLSEGNSRSIVIAASYWIFVEFGTIYMAARPFIRPALEALDKRAIVDQFFKDLGLR